jgi:hypothetical protein
VRVLALVVVFWVRDADCSGILIGRESMAEASSRSSSRRCVRRCLTPTEGCGSRTRRTSCTRTRMRMRRRVSPLCFCIQTSKLNSVASLIAHSLNWYRFIGRILGKAMYEGILVDVAFAGFFLARVSRSFTSTGAQRKKTNCLYLTVARSAELPRRSILARPRPVQWSHLPEALQRKPRGPVAQFHYGNRR